MLDPDDFKVEYAQCFDTYKSSSEFNQFIKRVQCIPDGYIMIAACQDDCVTNLSEEAIEWFESMGSDEISELAYRQSFVFIGVGGGIKAEEVNEKRGEPGQLVSVNQIYQISDDQALQISKNVYSKKNINKLENELIRAETEKKVIKEDFKESDPINVNK